MFLNAHIAYIAVNANYVTIQCLIVLPHMYCDQMSDMLLLFSGNVGQVKKVHNIL